MSTTEALRLQLDSLRKEKQQLEAQHARLQSDNSTNETQKLKEDHAILQQEFQKLKQLYEGTLRNQTESVSGEAGGRGELAELEERLREEISGRIELEQCVESLKEQVRDKRNEHRESEVASLELKLGQTQSECADLRETISQLNKELVDQQRSFEEEKRITVMGLELEKHRAVQKEREKWEKREEWLFHGQGTLPPSLRTNLPTQYETPMTPTAEEFVPHKHTSGEENQQESGTDATTPQPCKPSELPPIPNFNGTEKEGMGDFRDWLEQFELAADACQWKERTKLVQLTMRLRGTAYAFYRSCSSHQKSCYTELVQELRRRFTPVCIPVVQTNLFHERKQGPGESVDDYAQDLRQLFYKAYPLSQQATQETEDMGQSVLACQFVTGLRQEIKEKMVGTEGKLDLLLPKARFEEVKIRDVNNTGTSLKPPKQQTTTSSQDKRAGNDKQRQKTFTRSFNVDCYHCGLKGHMARDCRYRGRATPIEAKSKKPGNQIATLHTQNNKKSARVQELEKELQAARMEEALHNVKATLHNLVPEVDGK